MKPVDRPRVIIRHCETYDPQRIRAIVREGLQTLGLKPHGRTLVKPNLVAAGELFPHAHTRPEFTEGVLLAQDGVAGGYVFYIRDHKLHYVYNYMGLEEFSLISTVDVPEGESSLRYEFEPTGQPKIREGKGAPGRGQLYINGDLVSQCEFPYTVPIVFGIEGLSCGYDFGEAVTHKYAAPFRFTGKIKQVVLDMSGNLIEDDDAKVRLLLAQQ
jgi:arylsulfatase